MRHNDTTTFRGEDRPSSGRRPHRRRVLPATALAVALLAVGGCSTIEVPSALPSINLPTVTVTPELPAETSTEPDQETQSAAPVESAAPAEEEPASESQSGFPLWAWILIGVALLAGLLVWLGSAARRRSEAKQLTEDVITRGAWVVDHGTGALMGATDPDATQLAWSQLDGALVDLTNDLRRLEPSARGERATQLMEIRDAVSALRMTAETDAKARLAGGSAGSGTADGLFAARRRLADALAVLSDGDQQTS